MDKRFLSILGALVIIFVGIFIISQHSSNNKNGGSSSNAQPSSNIEGQGSKGVTLIEYGDYQCPVCGEFYQPLKQVFADNSQNIYFQFRNLPLTSLHPNAFSGARAAEAAGMQGRYWQMHDLLYDQNISYYNSGEKINNWINASNPLSDFQAYAQQLGLNVSKFTSDYSSSKVNNTINADLAAFAKTGQEEATPTFFLDGKPLNNTALIDTKTNSVSVSKFDQLIANEIKVKS